MTIERRRHPRFPLLAQITVQEKDEDIVMELLDLSRGGARLDLGGAKRPVWLRLGRTVQLHVPSPTGTLSLEGKIVRVGRTLNHREFGVQLTRLLDPATLAGIQQKAKAPAAPPPLPQTPRRRPLAPPPPNRRL